VNARPVTTANPRAVAVEAAADALRKLADALHLLAVTDERAPAAGPRLVTAREPEVLLTTAQALEMFPTSSRRSLEKLAKRCPEVARRIGARVWYERGALLRATRRTA